MPQLPTPRGSRRTRLAAFVLTSLLGFALLPVSVSAGAINTAELDNGQCVSNLQIGSDKTSSASNTPWFLVTANGAGTLYQLFVDGVGIGSFEANQFARVCGQQTKPLADGRHTLTGSEIRYNLGSITPFTFSVDTVAPAVPSSPSLAAFSDTGVQGDNTTSTTTPFFSGTAEPGVQIFVYGNGNFLGGAVADAGAWSARSSPLANGPYTIMARSKDQAGNMSAASGTINVVVDTVAPASPPAPTLDPASDSAPVGDNTTTVTTPTVTGVGAEASSTIAVYVDGAKVGTTTSNATGSWQKALPFQAIGTHSVTATAADLAANASGNSAALSLTIGTAAATVPGAPTLIFSHGRQRPGRHSPGPRRPTAVPRSRATGRPPPTGSPARPPGSAARSPA